jgi:hypothetical protein
MAKRVVHLGFEVRIDLELRGGRAAARAQLTRAQSDELELVPGDTGYAGYVRLPAGTIVPTDDRSPTHQPPPPQDAERREAPNP